MSIGYRHFVLIKWNEDDSLPMFTYVLQIEYFLQNCVFSQLQCETMGINLHCHSYLLQFANHMCVLQINDAIQTQPPVQLSPVSFWNVCVIMQFGYKDIKLPNNTVFCHPM